MLWSPPRVRQAPPTKVPLSVGGGPRADWSGPRAPPGGRSLRAGKLGSNHNQLRCTRVFLRAAVDTARASVSTWRTVAATGAPDTPAHRATPIGRQRHGTAERRRTAADTLHRRHGPQSAGVRASAESGDRAVDHRQRSSASGETRPQPDRDRRSETSNMSQFAISTASPGPVSEMCDCTWCEVGFGVTCGSWCEV